MEQFRTIVQYLTIASLLLAAAQIYLTLNKLWSRKHEPVVAESISIMGESLGLVPLLLLTMTFLLDGHWEGVVDGGLWLGAGAITILIWTCDVRRRRSSAEQRARWGDRSSAPGYHAPPDRRRRGVRRGAVFF